MKNKISFAWNVVVLLLFAGVAWSSRGFETNSRWLPMFVGIVGTVFAMINLVVDAAKNRRSTLVPAVENDRPPPNPDGERGEPGRGAEWIRVVALLVSVFLFGLLVVGPIWLVAMLRLKARLSWPRILAVAAAIGVALYLSSAFVGVHLPRGIVQLF